VYVADLVGGTAVLRPLFADNASATVANAGSVGAADDAALTDPDSNEVVSGQAPRLQGDFVLDSQGDQQQIYLRDLGQGGDPGLRVVDLSQSINDTAWVTARRGTPYVTDKSSGDVVVVRGPFDDIRRRDTPQRRQRAEHLPGAGLSAQPPGHARHVHRRGAAGDAAGRNRPPAAGPLLVGADGGEDPGAQGNEG
jgi:hypothetical protein